MSAEKLLLVKGRAGMGNRVLAVLGGILYARLTQRRMLVDWSDATYSNDGSNVFHRFFECSLCTAGEAVPETDSVNPALWRGRLTETVRAQQKSRPELDPEAFLIASRVDLSRLDHPEEVLVFWSYNAPMDILQTHFSANSSLDRKSDGALLSELLKTDLVLHSDIRRRVDDLAREHFQRPMIGVHIRYSDRRARLEVILKRLDRMVRRRPDAGIFLATDNIEVKEMLERRYTGVVTAPHWYPAPGEAAHQNADSPNRVENGIEALIDLYLLGRCQSLIVDTRSSLSRVATYLAAVESPIFDARPLARFPPGVRRVLRAPLARLGLRQLISDGTVGRPTS